MQISNWGPTCLCSMHQQCRRRQMVMAIEAAVPLVDMGFCTYITSQFMIIFNFTPYINVSKLEKIKVQRFF